jgi:type I restriction-modification system DNA methylase subunit
MSDHNYFANLIWQIADLLRGPYRPPQYERVMLPMTVLRRFDCALAPTKKKVLAEYERLKGGKIQGDALDAGLNMAAGGRDHRFHDHSPLDFEKLKGDSENIEKHLVSYIKGLRTFATFSTSSSSKPRSSGCARRTSSISSSPSLATGRRTDGERREVTD